MDDAVKEAREAVESAVDRLIAAIREPLESRLEALEGAVRETVENATIREHGEVWCGKCLKDVDTPSPECNICRLRELSGQEGAS